MPTSPDAAVNAPVAETILQGQPWPPRPEHERVPYVPLRELPVASLLVLAPHPDDEVFGCGGLIATALAQRLAVQVVVVSDGAAGGDAAVREAECHAAAAALAPAGGPAASLAFWRLPDRGLLPDDALVQRFAAAIVQAGCADAAGWVLAPSPAEVHPDHLAVFLAAQAACRATAATLVHYEVGQPLAGPNRLLDITPVLASKQRALHCFASQLAQQDYAEHISALNRYRAYTLGPAVTHAEAYRVIDAATATEPPPVAAAVPVASPAAAPPPATDDPRDRQLHELQRAHAALAWTQHQMERSLSWRITAPLRAMRALPRRGRSALRRVAASLSPRTRQRLLALLAAAPGGPRLLAWLRRGLPSPAAVPAPPVAAPAPVLDKEAVRAEAEAALGTFLAGPARLRFAPGPVPRVSVIVVLYNQAGLSLQCLQALAAAAAAGGPAFELILVDNASSDRMPALLARVDGATIDRRDENLGFLRAVNAAAQQARGEYLLLLNNDAMVFPDTLARAVARLDAEPDAGAVGGAILWWDGRLQEAGSLVWRDAACLGYGRADSPELGPYRFVRDVDYCSGALLLLRRAEFAAMGGFDDRFAPAYYEESDLCLRLWQAGRRVVYDPLVRVRHFEFASDVGSGNAMALQARNRGRFEAKHAIFLAGQQAGAHGPEPAANPALALLLARQRLPAGTPRVLVIDDRVPLPSLGRGYPRAAALLQALVHAGAFVTLYPLLFPHEDWQATYQALPERCEVMQGPGRDGLAGFLRERAGYYHQVLVSRPHNMATLQALLRHEPALLGGARLVYDAEALFSLRDIARAAVLGKPFGAAEQRRRIAEEMRLAQGAQAIVTVSPAEARHYREAGHAEVHVLGHTLAPRPGAAGFPARRGFLFVGATEGDDSPNTDSLLWFVREVWPRLVEALGSGARLDIVGPCESESIAALDGLDAAGSLIRVHGRVPSVDAFYDQARVFVVPTRFAAGIPHKAHEAAAHGLPMVVSPLIAEQLGWPALPQAADGPGFAQACLALHGDALGWSAAREQLLAAVARDCSPAAFEQTVRQLLAPVRQAAAEGVR